MDHKCSLCLETATENTVSAKESPTKNPCINTEVLYRTTKFDKQLLQQIKYIMPRCDKEQKPLDSVSVPVFVLCNTAAK